MECRVFAFFARKIVKNRPGGFVPGFPSCFQRGFCGFKSIIGPSGSGKSTIMRLSLGFETPDAGTVTYDGRELSTLDLREVRRPRILMFDEATSALDNLTQAIVTVSITRELRGITRVVIAHRLTTVIDADRIYMVKKGQIVQSGEHHQLLAEPGPFQELVHRQST